MTKAVVFGGKGMVGSRVTELLNKSFNIIVPSESEVNITDENATKEYLSKQKPQVVINFAAITDIDYCETERENKNGIVWNVNAKAPGLISEISNRLNFFFVQISTDMVFSGREEDPGPYSETNPEHKYENLTWYGASKLEGEKLVLKQNKNNSIVRIIYPVRNTFPGKLDYARKILALYDDGKLYPMFTDQHMNITYVDELAWALEKIIMKKIGGICHVAASNITTPYEFASYLLEKLRGIRGAVKKVAFKDFIKTRDPRRYPQFGGLAVEKTQRRLQTTFFSCRDIVDELALSLQ